MKKIEFTFLLPCYNEELTIVDTINEIKSSIKRFKLNAEILVIDNNSSDNSNILASSSGARVIKCYDMGYGNALRCGFNNAYGKYIIMGDSDTTYDFTNIDLFIKHLRDGYLFVIGNRYHDGYFKSNISFSHYFGGKFISFFGKIKYKIGIKDFNCGLRGINTKFIKGLKFKQCGMEFATEMIGVISKNTDKIIEVPTRLRKCKYKDRKVKLNVFRDGFRHLIFILRGEV